MGLGVGCSSQSEPPQTKDLIAIAVAHVTPCPYCIRAHTKSALAKGAMEKEITEAMWVAAEMRAGGAVAHSALAIDVMKEHVEAYCWIGILLDEKGRRRVTAKQCQGPGPHLLLVNPLDNGRCASV
jgi:AhpD family alkylhydroperoxidase